MTTSTADTPPSLPFSTFWTWLKRHNNCVLRVGTPDIYICDHELFHWQFEEDAEGNPDICLCFGKTRIAEMLIEARLIQFANLVPAGDPDNPEHVLVQIIGAEPGDDPYILALFLMSHSPTEDDLATLNCTFRH